MVLAIVYMKAHPSPNFGKMDGSVPESFNHEYKLSDSATYFSVNYYLLRGTTEYNYELSTK